LVSAKIEACSGAALIMDSCKIYYSVNDGAFVSAPLYSTADPDSFYGHIPAQGPGAEVKYFIRAADLSGRVENHPFIGEPWAHAYSVTAANEPPVLAEIGPQEVDEGSNLSFTVYASDPDLTIPSIDAENLPDNATLDDNGDGTAAFDFTPDNTQAGIYSVLFIASDGSLADSEWVPITVNDINLPCYIIDPDTLLCRTEEYFSFYPEIVDPDDTTHDVTYSGYPPWLSESYDSIVGTPSIAENVSFTVEVSDGVNTDDAQVNLVIYMCGDCDSSGGVDIDDAVAIITYIFQSGSAPDPAETGDVDCSGGIDIDDAVYIITYIFSGGPPPCESCP
jgi:hypothetical protein